MNLTCDNVTFQGSTRHASSVQHTTRRPRYSSPEGADRADNKKYNEDGDSFEKKKISPRETARIQRRRRGHVNRLIGFMLAASMAGGGVAIMNATKGPEPNFITQDHSIVEISDFTGVNPDVLLYANGLQKGDNLPEEIIVPTEISPWQAKIDALETKVQDKSISVAEYEAIKSELDTLYKKQDLQTETAKVYEDDKYAYIVPNEDINVEELKERFGIEDGVVVNNNNISYTCEQYDDGSSYKNYTTSRIEAGEIIKVPIGEINKLG